MSKVGRTTRLLTVTLGFVACSESPTMTSGDAMPAVSELEQIAASMGATNYHDTWAVTWWVSSCTEDADEILYGSMRVKIGSRTVVNGDSEAYNEHFLMHGELRYANGEVFGNLLQVGKTEQLSVLDDYDLKIEMRFHVISRGGRRNTFDELVLIMSQHGDDFTVTDSYWRECRGRST